MTNDSCKFTPFFLLPTQLVSILYTMIKWYQKQIITSRHSNETLVHHLVLLWYWTVMTDIDKRMEKGGESMWLAVSAQTQSLPTRYDYSKKMLLYHKMREIPKWLARQACVFITIPFGLPRFARLPPKKSGEGTGTLTRREWPEEKQKKDQRRRKRSINGEATKGRLTDANISR